jgi:hypothetical protein
MSTLKGKKDGVVHQSFQSGEKVNVGPTKTLAVNPSG